MNSVELLEVSYLRANITIETILLTDLSDSSRQKVVYVYNFQGYHYRIFDNIMEIAKFLHKGVFGNEFKILGEYSKDSQVDNFLETYDMRQLREIIAVEEIVT